MTNNTFTRRLLSSVLTVLSELLSWLLLTSSLIILNEFVQTSLTKHWSGGLLLERSVTSSELELDTLGWALKEVTSLALSTGIDIELILKRGGFAVWYLDVVLTESIFSIKGRDDLSVSTSSAPRHLTVSLAEVTVVESAPVNFRNDLLVRRDSKS